MFNERGPVTPEYIFTPEAWGMHDKSDSCPYDELVDPRRTGYLTDDVKTAVQAVSHLEKFLNGRPSEPIRTYRSGVDLTIDNVPLGTILELTEESFLFEDHWHEVRNPRWGVVVVHQQYGEQEVPGIVTIPQTAIKRDGKVYASQSVVQSVNHWITPPAIMLHDIPLRIGEVEHTRIHLPAGDINSPDPNERLYAVQHPEPSDHNSLKRVIKVDLWHQGSSEKGRSLFKLGDPFRKSIFETS